MKKVIALIDCNNFFVSCERLFRPDLKGKPVVVLSSNDGCVVARSQEIKDNGIPMGVPYFQIKDSLKDMKATVFSSHFALYRDISRRVFSVVKSKYPNIEEYSIDECFFTLESEDPRQEALSLKRQVEQAVGIPVSIGLASSKTLAKYANSLAKKGPGVSYLENADFVTLAPNISLYDIWGVGAGRSRSFTAQGLRTAFDLLKAPEAFVRSNFGVEGARLQAELLGRSAYPIVYKRSVQKSLMSSRSFKNTTNDIGVLREALNYHLYQCVEELARADLLVSTLRIVIAPGRHSDFAAYGASLEVDLLEPTKDLFLLEREVEVLLKRCFKPGIPYKKAGVLCSHLVPALSVTTGLFDNENALKTKALTDTILSLNQRFGKAALTLGVGAASSSLWQSKRDLISPAYTTNWNQLKTVK